MLMNEFKDLLKLVLNNNADKRPDIEKVLDHKWFKGPTFTNPEKCKQ